MASMRDIKRRKSSIQSTQQITKAMKLVSTVKLQKAKRHALETNPYTRFMQETVTSILRKSGNILHPYLHSGTSEKKAVIVITSNRGLAGGYNMNVIRLVTDSGLPMEDLEIYAVGLKGKEGLSRRGYQITEDVSDMMESPDYSQASELCEKILDRFRKKEIGEIYLASTHYKNTVSHEAVFTKLLPVEIKGEDEEDGLQMNFEPSAEETLDLIIPKYISSLLYGALTEAAASENAARMQAMDSATDNAEEMIDDLTLKYNRARQGSITQELTEIIAGAQAIT